jgi:hypothetical protein
VNRWRFEPLALSLAAHASGIECFFLLWKVATPQESIEPNSPLARLGDGGFIRTQDEGRNKSFPVGPSDIGNDTGCPMAPPNGSADLIPDVTHALNKFSNATCAPKKTRVDVEPEKLDMLTGITDVLQILGAFSSGSSSYGFPSGASCLASTANAEVTRTRMSSP